MLEHLAKINEVGYLLSSLSQLDTGDWRAELRTSLEALAKGELTTLEVGFGPTCDSALEMAFHRIERKERRTLVTAASEIVGLGQPRTTGASLLASLDLRPVEDITI